MDERLSAEWERICALIDEVGLEHLPHRDRVFSAIWMLEAEVGNGGFCQYMFNDHGDDALVALSGLREIGADELANVCERFYALLPGGRLQSDREAREAQLEDAAEALGELVFEERCHQLEQEFYALGRVLHDKLLAYMELARATRS